MKRVASAPIVVNSYRNQVKAGIVRAMLPRTESSNLRSAFGAAEMWRSKLLTSRPTLERRLSSKNSWLHPGLQKRCNPTEEQVPRLAKCPEEFPNSREHFYISCCTAPSYQKTILGDQLFNRIIYNLWSYEHTFPSNVCTQNLWSGFHIGYSFLNCQDHHRTSLSTKGN